NDNCLVPVAQERGQELPGGRIPHLRRPIPRAPGGEGLAVGAEGRGQEIEVTATALEERGGEGLPGGRLPHLRCAVAAVDEDSLAVRAEGGDFDLLLVVPEIVDEGS